MIIELFPHRSFIKILFAVSQYGFPVFESPNVSRKIFGKFLYPPPNPLTHPPCHSPPPNTRNCEPTQNFKFDFLNYTFVMQIYMYFPRPSYYIIQNNSCKSKLIDYSRMFNIHSTCAVYCTSYCTILQIPHLLQIYFTCSVYYNIVLILYSKWIATKSAVNKGYTNSGSLNNRLIDN